MTGDRYLIDTDVLVDYLRDQGDAVAFLTDHADGLVASMITVAELFAGVREGDERRRLELLLDAFELVPVSRRIAEKGGQYRRTFGRSHGVGLADALIAATAEDARARLVTLNVKHFPMLGDALRPYGKS